MLLLAMQREANGHQRGGGKFHHQTALHRLEATCAYVIITSGGVEWNTGKSWSQNFSFCTDSTAFKIYEDQERESRGYKQEDFSQYDCAGEGFCHVTIWPEKVSFTPLYIDSIIAQQRKMQNQQDLLSSTLAN